MRILSARSCTRFLVTVFGIGACTTATEPVDPALHAFIGTFVLLSVDGAPVPVLQLAYTYTRRYLAADTLIADGRGRYSRITVSRTDSVARAYSAFQRVTGAGTYTVRGDTVDFPMSCPPGAACTSPPVGWREADGSFVLAYPSTQGFRFVSHFVRVR